MVSLKGRRQRCYHCHSTGQTSVPTGSARGWRGLWGGLRECGDWHFVCQDGWNQESSSSAITTARNESYPRRNSTESKTGEQKYYKREINLPSPKRTESPDKPSPPLKPARDSPASPPPEKTKTEKKEEPVEIPAERKDKGQSPKKKSQKKTATAEIMREELEAVKRKVQSKKNPSLVGMYTHGPGKRRAGESLETEKKQETKTRRGSRSRSRTRDGTTKESPTK